MAVVGMRIYPGTDLFERAVAEGRIARDADLLAPTYYLAPGLTAEAVFAQLEEFARRSPNWIVGDPAPGLHQPGRAPAPARRGRAAVELFRHAAAPVAAGRRSEQRMTMKRLLLISPRSPRTASWAAGFSSGCRAWACSKSPRSRRPDWQVTIIDEKVEPLDLDQDADLVGITTMTTTAPPGLRNCRPLPPPRHQGRDGRDARFLPARGSAGALRQRGHRRSRRALARGAGGFRAERTQALYRHADGLPPLMHLPRPDWELYRTKTYLPVHFVETTRGCPIDCEFCAVTTRFWRQVPQPPAR